MSVFIVTGASGFLGQSLCRFLKTRGDFVIGVGGRTCLSSDLPYLDYVVPSALCDTDFKYLYSLFPAVDVLFHLSGSSSVAASEAHPQVDFDSGPRSTFFLLQAVASFWPHAKVVFSSSAAVYGDTRDYPISDRTTVYPISTYGRGKQLSEFLLEDFSRRCRIDVVIVRFFSIFGPGLRKQIFWDLFHRVRGLDCSVLTLGGTGSEVRDWLFVDDAISLLVKFADLDSSGVIVVNAGSGVGHTVRYASEAFFHALGLEIDVVFSGLERLGDPKQLVADISSLRALGWEPKVRFEDGLDKYVRFLVTKAD